jgi:hypothetical protein
MGDAGEGLIDNDARIQERRDELDQARKRAREQDVRDPAALQLMESLRLTRADLKRKIETTTNDRRRVVLTEALADLDRQIAAAATKIA